MMMLGCRKLEMLVISMITFGIMNLSISIIFITRTGGYEDDTSNFTIMIPSKVQDVIKHTLKWAIEEPSLSNLPSCIKDDVLCRYDDVGDFLESAVNEAIVHEPLPSVPSQRRIPHEKANDWSYILAQRNAAPEDGSATALMDYNLILIPLYKNVRKSDGSYSLESDLDPILLDRLTGKYHPYFTDAEVNRVKYLSVSRTSNLHSCKPKFKFHFGTLAQDFLGLSLLDENLSRIEGTDVAINLDKWLLGNMTAVFHDVQVVPATITKGRKHKDQLFLFPSGHLGTFAFPIDIRRVPPVTEASKFGPIPFHTKFNATTIPFSHEFMYGDGMEIKISANTDGIKERQCHRRADLLFNQVQHGIDRGKNFHFFESNTGEMFMEIWPFGTHRTVPVNILMNDTTISAMNLFPQRKKFYQQKNGKNFGRFQWEFENLITSKNMPLSWSFQSETPKHERPYMRFRGTSQIIDMVLNGVDVKVGIAHTVAQEHIKVTDKRAYLSQFYAFHPYPPFDIVAISGHFCFNHMNENDIGYSAQWISARPIKNRTAPILIKSENYRCPIITFASGMNEMIGHKGENVIISYGVNDCYSRSIVVPKKKIEMLLLGKQVESINMF